MASSQVFKNRQFSDFYDDGCGATYCDLEFVGCTFANCWLSMTEQPESRNTFRQINLVNSTHINCGIDVAIVEDVCVDGLVSSRDPFFAHGAVFRHVVLKGKLDPIVLKSRPVAAVEDLKIREVFREAVEAYYSDVDWALDITEAECTELSIHGIPADLIRRDPETQVVVRSNRISAGIMESLLWLGPEFRMSLELFLKRRDKDVVLVAPKRKRQVQRLIDEIRRLRDLGIADCD